jgi:hypothetical protein
VEFTVDRRGSIAESTLEFRQGAACNLALFELLEDAVEDYKISHLFPPEVDEITGSVSVTFYNIQNKRERTVVIDGTKSFDQLLDELLEDVLRTVEP